MKFENRTLKKLLFFSCMICQLQAIPNTHIQSDPINPKYPIKTVVKEATTQASPKKKKALVAVFGVFSRSLRKTWPQINKMIVKPLERDYDVEIYGFNNQVDNIDTLDDQPIQKSSADTIKTNHKLVYDEVRQSQLDEYIQKDNSWITQTWIKSRLWSKYLPHVRKNAVRQLYLEQHVSDYIASSNKDYDVVIALIADVYPLVPLSMNGTNLADNAIFTVSFRYEGHKYANSAVTNGYYLGDKQSVAKIMSTVATIDSLEDKSVIEQHGYEKIVHSTLSINKLEGRWTNMLFCKLKNDFSVCAQIWHVYGSDQFRRLGPIQRLRIYFQEFLIRKTMSEKRIFAYVVLPLVLVIIISRKLAMLYRANIHKKRFL